MPRAILIPSIALLVIGASPLEGQDAVIQPSGGISAMLVIGPVDPGRNTSPGGSCSDGGRLGSVDYLSNADASVAETNILAAEGDEVEPDFGGVVDAVGVKAAANPNINLDAAAGILTVWRANADLDGYINFNDFDKIGDPVDDYLVYSLVYLENTTAECLGAVLEVGSDDSVKVLVNGALVHVNGVCRGIPPAGGGDSVPVLLLPGVNVVLIAVVERGGGTGVRLMLRDSAGVPLTDGSVEASLVPPAQYLPGSRVTRRISATIFEPGTPVTVTVAAEGISGAATITESFPPGWTIENFGAGMVNGNTVTFELTGDAELSYDLTAPANACEDVSLSGIATGAGIAGGLCDQLAVTGDSLLRCLGVGGIVISDDDWANFVELGTEPGQGNPATPAPSVVITDDGRPSLYFSGDPGDNLGYAIYRIDVTGLPGGGPGPERFPVTMEARHFAQGGMVIRNLTVAPIPPAGYQNQASFAGVMIDGDAGVFALGTGEQPFDPCLDLLDRDEGADIIVKSWSTVGLANANATLPTDVPASRSGIVATIKVLLDLVEGENILRLDTNDLRQFPCNPKSESGQQLFTIRIGAKEPDLTGAVVPPPCPRCRVTRQIVPSVHEPGDTVTVMLDAEEVSPGTTIVETIPAGWTVQDSGGGVVNGNTISFAVSASGQRSYSLGAPGGDCDRASIAGTINSPCEFCGGAVEGASSLICRPAGTEFFDFDGEGPTTSAEIENFFLLLGNDKPAWTIDPNTTNAANGTLALHTTADGAPGLPFFSRVAILRPEIFEGENVFVGCEITWDDNDFAGIYFRFTGESDHPLDNSYYFLEIYADNRGMVLHRVKDGVETPVSPTVNQPVPVVPGSTVNLGIEADGDEITVFFNGLPVPGLDPIVDVDPILGCGAIGVGQETNPTFFDNLIFGRLDDGPCPCTASRSLSTTLFQPGDTVTVTLRARNVNGESTITENFPEGWEVSGNPDGGVVDGHSIAFSLDADGQVSYELRIPEAFCETGELAGTIRGGGGCDGEVRGSSSLSCVFGCAPLRDSGAVPSLLILGPIDAGGNTSLNGLCDDSGKLGTTDYLAGAEADEIDIEAVFGDDIAPDFGGAAGGVGVGLAPNVEINPRRQENVLTVWLADTDADGAIDFNQPDKIGDPLDDYIVYSLIYLENTTNADLDVNLLVGSDDAVKVRVNGEMVHLNSICRGIGAVGAADVVPATLLPGINTVLIAVVERGGGTGVRLLVQDPVGLPLTDGRVVACLSPRDIGPPRESFKRGDTDASGVVDISDPIFNLTFQFIGGVELLCVDAADVDDSGVNDISDPIYSLQWQFVGGIAPPPAPGPTSCGLDPTPDDLRCESYPAAACN